MTKQKIDNDQKKINKIFDLEIDDIYFQINHNPAFQYLDKKGELMELLYSSDNKPIAIFPNENGDILVTKEDKNEMKFCLNTYWEHYRLPKNLDETRISFIKNVNKIIPVFKIKKVERIGWRISFVYSYKIEQYEEARKTIDKLFLNHPNYKFDLLRFKTTIKDIRVVCTVKGVAKKTNSKLLGILFDVDFYKNYKEGDNMPISNLKKELIKIDNVIKGSEFIELVNFILKK